MNLLHKILEFYLKFVVNKSRALLFIKLILPSKKLISLSQLFLKILVQISK